MHSNDTTARQYGATIAIVSGVYSLLTATGAGGMMTSNSGLLMLLLGVIVIVHGVALLTPYAARLGSASGPLMIAYAVVMLVNQAAVGVTGSVNWGMGGGMMGGGMMTGGMRTGVMGGMGYDLGMIALAVLMLVSGVLMTDRSDGTSRM